jgi:lipopolysaccharide export system protein LptA/lipopolysaccharide export system protein LptC
VISPRTMKVLLTVLATIVVSVLPAVFIYMVLRYTYSDWERSLESIPNNPAADKPDITPGPASVKFQEKGWHKVTENLDLMHRDSSGREDMHFQADRVAHQTGKSWDVTRPRMQFFSRAGEIINLAADQGKVLSGGNPMALDQLESGVLWGHVVLIHDRGTPDDESDDLVVNLEEITFNNETYELATDGPVVMVGSDMQMTARKMRVAMDRTTHRVTTLTFGEDIRLTMDLGDKARFLAVPTEPAPPPAKAEPTKLPAKAGGPAADTTELWRIDLVGNVDARQDVQKMTCQHLNLYNRASKGATNPVGNNGATKGRPTAPKKTGSQPSRGQMVVMADGPLIVTPVSATERQTLGDKQYLVTATGAPVVVDDGQTKVVGGEVYYNSQTGSGTVIGRDAPILLEQPGRMRLTGNRLDFDRQIRPGHELPTADIQGSGTLLAQVQMADVVPADRTQPPAATRAAQEPRNLDAVWSRGMHLEFYQMASTLGTTTTGAAATQVRTAIFHGQAVLKQRDSILKGDDLTIDFFKAEAGRGQAVERLRGQGNVFVKNQPPVDSAAKATSSSNAGDIACQKLDMTFRRDANGDPQPSRLEASGSVVIHEIPSANALAAASVVPQKPSIAADQLVIDFGLSAKGSIEPRFFEAVGNALVNREDLYAEGDHIRRDMNTGMLLLEGKPAKAARGQTRIQGPRIEFNQTDGIATVQGAGELQMPSSTDLRGARSKTAEPMLIRWQKGMLFEDARNFAQFDGAASAVTAASRLDCDRLWVYFINRTRTGAAVTATAPAAPVVALGAPVTPGKASPAKAAAPKSGDEMSQLFGSKDTTKDIAQVFAEKNVRAIEQQLEADGTLRYQMEMAGDNLTYVAENRNAYMRSPGRIRILSHEKAAPDQPQSPGIAPATAVNFVKGDLPAGYSRTEVSWAKTMAYDSAGEQAYFSGNVDALYTGRRGPGAAAARGKVSDMRVQGNEVQVAFSQKAAATGTAAAATPLAPSAAAPAAGVEDRMNVEKFVANGNVRLAMDNRRGTGERLIYQRVPEIVFVYGATDDWARLWEEDEAKQQFNEFVAKTISYEPTTGTIKMQQQQTITVSPRAVVPKKK